MGMATAGRKVKRFERAVPGGGVANASDEEGSVRVIVQLFRDSKYVTGNISRTVTVANARVSEVAAAVEEALFGSNKVA